MSVYSYGFVKANTKMLKNNYIIGKKTFTNTHQRLKMK